jgi:hypothetical protein
MVSTIFSTPKQEQSAFERATWCDCCGLTYLRFNRRYPAAFKPYCASCGEGFALRIQSVFIVRNAIWGEARRSLILYFYLPETAGKIRFGQTVFRSENKLCESNGFSNIPVKFKDI